MTDHTQKLSIAEGKKISLGQAYEHEVDGQIIIFHAATAKNVAALQLQDLSDCTHLSVFKIYIEHFNTAYLSAV